MNHFARLREAAQKRAIRAAAIEASVDDLFAVRDLPPRIEATDADGFEWHADDCACPSCYRPRARAVSR